MCTASTELIKRVNLCLREWEVKEPRVARVLTPVREWAETLTTPLPSVQAPLPAQGDLDAIIDSLLVTIPTTRPSALIEYPASEVTLYLACVREIRFGPFIVAASAIAPVLLWLLT